MASKEQERAELHRTIWQIANNLRGSVDTVKEKGFYVLPSELFKNVTKNTRDDSNLNETLSNVFKNIESSAKGTESEDDLKGLFDVLDVNSNKLGNTVEQRNKQLVKLLESINELRLGNYSDNTNDYNIAVSSYVVAEDGKMRLTDVADTGQF